jgi:hypothetical protein
MNDPDSRSGPSREELIALVAAQAAEIAALKAHIAELERRLGLNSIPRLIEESEKFLAFGGLMDSAGV